MVRAEHGASQRGAGAGSPPCQPAAPSQRRGHGQASRACRHSVHAWGFQPRCSEGSLLSLCPPAPASCCLSASDTLCHFSLKSKCYCCMRVLDSQTNGGDAPGFLLLFFYKRSYIRDILCPCSINSSQVLISFSERREFFRQVKGKGKETSFLNL